MGILMNVLCQVGVTTIIAKFLILDIPIDRDAPIVVGRGFIYTIGGIVNTPERLFSTFEGICYQTFRAARSNVLRTIESDSDDKEEYAIKRNNFGEPIYGSKPAAYLNCNYPAERSVALQAVINLFWKISVWEKAVSFLGSLPALLQHFNRKPNYKGCYTNEEEAKGQLWEETMMKLDHQDPNALDNTKPWKRYCFHKFIMNSYYEKVATEMRSLEIDDMLRIKLRKAKSNEEIFTSMALGLYHAEELDEDGFDVYFQGGLRSDDHFNAQEYWLSISREENMSLSRSHVSNIQSLVLRVIHKMITYGLCQRTAGYDKIQNNDLWLLSMFNARHQNGYVNVAWLIARWIKRKDLDTTTLRELIDSEGRLIPEDPQPGVPRVGIPRPLRASMQDFYAGVFEHMVGVYSIDLQGAYNPPGYAQPQHDQYYQQYPPQLPQYQQKQIDDE
ncbi:hypothetical protein Tco_1139600 [Tanacetum coccineum]